MLRATTAARRLVSIALQPSRRRCYASGTAQASRITRLESRLPRFLRHITTPLRSAPLSHITAFLVLHELTAIVPLFGLAGAFHYFNWLPPYISEGQWISGGVEKFGRWLRKRGWISEADDRASRSGRWWTRGEGGVRIVTELATAYAITKVLLPLRLVISVWATPWFARWTVLPFTAMMKRYLWRTKAGQLSASPAAGTGAIAGGAIPKNAGVK